MALDIQNSSALMKRAEQIKRWEESDTNREPAYPKNEKKRKIKFSPGCVFLAACVAGDKDEVERLLESNADINTTNVDGLTALHQACIDDNLEMVEFLVECGADINQQDNEGWTPLHATASCGFVSIARYLVEYGADVAAVNSDGELALDLATSSSMKEYLQYIIDELGIDCENARLAEEQLMLSDAKKWLRSDSSESDRPHSKTGATALHVAAAKGYTKVLSLLLAGRANVNKQDNDGWTPLHAATHWGQKEAVEMLLDSFADMEIKNYSGQSPIDVAEEHIVKYLEDIKLRKRKTRRRPTSQIRISDATENNSESPSKMTKKEDTENSEIFKDAEPTIVQDIIEDNSTQRKRGGSTRLRSQTENLPKTNASDQDKKNNDNEVILRRTQSFEHDEKFYRKYHELRARIKANSCPLIQIASNITNDLSNTDDSLLKPILSQFDSNNSSGITSSVSDTSLTHGSAQVRRSVVLPIRDEESETQRKAHAKRVRETRRSTQGITLDEIKSAEELVKKQNSPSTLDSLGAENPQLSKEYESNERETEQKTEEILDTNTSKKLCKNNQNDIFLEELSLNTISNKIIEENDINHKVKINDNENNENLCSKHDTNSTRLAEKLKYQANRYNEIKEISKEIVISETQKCKLIPRCPIHEAPIETLVTIFTKTIQDRSACIDDNLEMVEFLVEHGADINRQDNEGWTPLHATSSCGFVSIARYLIENGADITAINSDGELAIDLSSTNAMGDYLQNLIDEQGIDCQKARQIEKQLMLNDAKKWLRSDASEADKPHPKTGATALHVAAAKGYTKVLSFLLAGRANVDKQDNDGWTPLHAAAHWGQKESAEMLMDAMADIDIKNYAGQTPLDVADPKIIKFLEVLKASKKRTKRRPTSQIRISDNIENSIETPPKVIRVEVKSEQKDSGNEDVLSSLERISESEETDSDVTDSTESSHSTSVSESLDDKPKQPPENIPPTRLQDLSSGDDTPWRRTGSVRTKNQQDSPPKTQVPDKDVKSNDTEVILRRTQSFENDEKFYQKYHELRARIKANSCPVLPATKATIIGAINTPNNHTVQRSASLKDHRNNRNVVSPPVSPKSPTSNPSSAQVRRSFVPPVRDEESETQRKAHAKRVRETRRSTQGVTLDEIKSAEELVKKNNLNNNNNISNSNEVLIVPTTTTSKCSNNDRVSMTITTTSDDLNSTKISPDKPNNEEMSASYTIIAPISSKSKDLTIDDKSINNKISASYTITPLPSTIFTTSNPSSIINSIKNDKKENIEQIANITATVNVPNTSIKKTENYLEDLTTTATGTVITTNFTYDNKSRPNKLCDNNNDKTYEDSLEKNKSKEKRSILDADNMSSLSLAEKLAQEASKYSANELIKTINDSLTTGCNNNNNYNNNNNNNNNNKGDCQNQKTEIVTTLTSPSHNSTKRRPSWRQKFEDNLKDGDAENQEKNFESEEKESGNERNSRSRIGSTNSIADSEQNESNKQNEDLIKNGEFIDYKALWEAAKLENEKLKTHLKKKDEELTATKSALERFTNATTKNSLTELEKREKRAMERKLSEMEEELKHLDILKTENQRLKEENAALIRVISKLSK